MLDHGVASVLVPGGAAVVAVGDAFAPARAGECRDHGRFGALLETACVVGIDDGTAGEAPVAELPGIEGDGAFLPVHQVTADRVAPVHIAPAPTIRIVLVEKVI